MTTISQRILTLGTYANGDVFTVPVFTVNENADGPSVYIQANIHGAEVQGNAVIYHLLRLFEQHSPLAKITIVPYANPIGTNIKMGEYTYGRFDPTTGNNWNRNYYFNTEWVNDFVSEHKESAVNAIRDQFKARLAQQVREYLSDDALGISVGERLALELQLMAHDADIVLDLHTGPCSSQHLYVPEYAKASARYFSIPHTILVPNEFAGALDEATFCPWWELYDAFVAAGRTDLELSTLFESFTVELGSHEQIDLTQALSDAENLLAYLSYKGVFSGDTFQPKQMKRYAAYLLNFKTYYAPAGGLVEYVAPLGKPLARGQTLARSLNLRNYGNPEVISELSLPVDALPILHFSSAVVHSGSELYKFFVNYFEL